MLVLFSSSRDCLRQTGIENRAEKDGVSLSAVTKFKYFILGRVRQGVCISLIKGKMACAAPPLIL